MHDDFRLRINGQDPFFHHIHFVPAQRSVGRNDLPVQVREADHIVIHQFQMADAAAGQGFRHVAAHSPDAENADTGGSQLFHIFFS